MNFDRLRSLLLEQAIRGELVEQQAIDFAVPVVDGVLPKESYPFEIPDHWKWYPLGKIVEYGKCTQIGSGEISETTWVLDLEDIEKGTGRLVNKKRGTLTTSNKAKFCKGDVLYGKLRPYLNKVLIADEDGVCTTEIVPISVVTAKLPLLAEYLQSYLMSPFFLDYANKISYGVKMPRLGTKDAKAALIPVPPVEEQARIVAKLEEAFAEIDRAEKAYEELQTLSEVLRSQILQKAIQGELVPQLNLEPAVDMRGDYPEEEPFEIPNKWKWVSLKEVVTFNPKIIKDDALDVSFIPMAGVDAGYVNECETNQLKPWGKVKKSGFSRFEEGDVLLAKITPCFQNRKSCIARNLANETGAGSTEFHVMRCSEYLNPKYLLWVLKSEYFINYGVSHFSGTVGQQRFSTQEVKDCFIPLPPKQEQERIIEKVDELMKQLDALGGITS